MTPQPIGAFIIVVNANSQVLLGQRKNSYKSGLYGCPGGRLELEETLEKCAKRELFEETGLKAKTLKYLGVIRELQDGYNFIHFCYMCHEYEGEIILKEPDKCLGWSFFNQSNLPEHLLPAHAAGIRLLREARSNTCVEILK